MTFIIAEIGINHNGSLDYARKLIDAAKWAGADAVKFQKRTLEIVYSGQMDNFRDSPWGRTVGDQKRGLEFNEAQYDHIAFHCKEINIPWFASAWDLQSLEFLNRYDLPYHKIASAMMTNDEYLKAVPKYYPMDKNKMILMSMGMCSWDNVLHARDILETGGCEIMACMHCVSTYPADEKDLNLSVIPQILKRTGCVPGYSGHETSVSPSVMAAVLGAEVIERHITLDRSMYGSDQAASLEPEAFRSMVTQIRKIPVVLGDGVKRITEAEQAVARKLRYWL